MQVFLDVVLNKNVLRKWWHAVTDEKQCASIEERMQKVAYDMGLAYTLKNDDTLSQVGKADSAVLCGTWYCGLCNVTV